MLPQGYKTKVISATAMDDLVVETNWMIPAAAGAIIPNVCTCAMTSCLLFFSSSAVISNCFLSRYYQLSEARSLSDRRRAGRTRLFFICSIAMLGIGSPSSFSAMARLSQSFRQVWCRFF